jgi:hypothetical protein
MKFLPSLRFLLLGLCAALAGCSTTAKPDSIIVTVADLKAADLTPAETRVLMTLRFTSESVNAFAFASSTHKLYVNGSYLGRAASKTPIGMPPLSTVTKDVTLVPDNAALLKQLRTLPGEPVVRFKGSAEGTIDLRGLQSGAR